MDERERQALYEETGLGGDIGENVVAAEYEVGEERGETGRKERGTPLLRGVAEGGEITVKGVVGMTRGDKTKVNGAAVVALGNDTKVTGWAEVAGAMHDVRIEKGATAFAVAVHEVELKDHGYAGVVLAPKVEVKDGGRVLITAFAAILGGLAIGTGFGLVLIGGIWLLRRSGFFMQRPGEKSAGARAEEQVSRRIRGAIRGALRG